MLVTLAEALVTLDILTPNILIKKYIYYNNFKAKDFY